MASAVPVLRVWAEYTCPWSYLAAVRLQAVLPEFVGRTQLAWKALPQEWVNDRPTPRPVLEAEWWPVALHDGRAAFAPYIADTYPDSTLLAFAAAKCAVTQGYEQGLRYDLAVREAFFGRSLDISRREVLIQLARETKLDLARFEREIDGGEVMRQVRSEFEEGAAFLDPQGTPSFVLPNDKQIFNPAAAELTMEGDKIVAVGAMPCVGDNCDDQYRRLLDDTLHARV